ncbi:MAG TPA: hypothetical protein VFA11_01715 [Acidimicrobiales bacterium]|nr:hypothetical protein [Acidimicrobiales bacterium]
MRAALGEAERSLASPVVGRLESWSRTVRQDLEALLAAVDLHVSSTEAPGAVLDGIVAAAPHLAPRVDQARHEHELIRYRLRSALDLLPATTETAAHTARDRAVEALEAIVRHRQLGSDLVYEAFKVDIESPE